MKVLFVNLPYPGRFTRRYMCTYTSATSLFPPYELMSVAGEVRSKEAHDIRLVDCVAENLDEKQFQQYVDDYQPDVMLSLIGLDSFERDINSIKSLKNAYPQIVQIGFGHYPTTFPEEILKQSCLDIIIKGEPDEVMTDILKALKEQGSLDTIPGIAFKNNNGDIIITVSRKRIIDLNKLSFPAHDLVDAKNYFEPFLSNPFGMIQTSRGCPFTCNFCVTSYGNKFTAKSPETVVNELKWMKSLHDIQSFRIIDDTFTIQKQRVIDICNLMIQEKLELKWTCLSRVDTLTEEMLKSMRDAGCVRIYFGLESGSQKVLDLYSKGADIETADKVLRWCRDLGIETVGLFMAGLPSETDVDFEETISFAKRVPLTFAGVGELTPYPGTDLYKIYKDEMEFSLFPYKLKFKNTGISNVAIARRNQFHRKFYLRGYSVFTLAKVALKNPRNLLQVVKNLYTARKYGTTLYPYLHN